MFTSARLRMGPPVCCPPWYSAFQNIKMVRQSSNVNRGAYSGLENWSVTDQQTAIAFLASLCAWQA